jgi:hypothetical protein
MMLVIPLEVNDNAQSERAFADSRPLVSAIGTAGHRGQGFPLRPLVGDGPGTRRQFRAYLFREGEEFIASG